jgi:hypothetical protein
MFPTTREGYLSHGTYARRELPKILPRTLWPVKTILHNYHGVWSLAEHPYIFALLAVNIHNVTIQKTWRSTLRDPSGFQPFFILFIFSGGLGIDCIGL